MPTLIALLATAFATGGLYWLAGQDRLGPDLLPAAWMADLATFFMPFVVIGLFVLLVLPTLSWRRPVVAVFAIGAVVAGLGWARLSSAEATLPGEIRVVSFNVRFDNRDSERTRTYLDEIDADVVVFQEFMYGWHGKMKRWTEWPVRYSGRGSNVAVMSRLPLSRTDPEPYRVLSSRIVRLALSRSDDPADGEFVVYGIHPPTPREMGRWEDRNAVLDELAGYVRAEKPGTAVVVAGDWNTPTWSPHLVRFLDETGFSNAHEGWWPPPTRISLRDWVPPFVGSPVDRIVVSPEIAVTRSLVGPDLGSDHLPVVADIALPPVQAGN